MSRVSLRDLENCVAMHCTRDLEVLEIWLASAIQHAHAVYSSMSRIFHAFVCSSSFIVKLATLNRRSRCAFRPQVPKVLVICTKRTSSRIQRYSGT